MTAWKDLGIKKQFAIHAELERKLQRSVDRSVIKTVWNLALSSLSEEDIERIAPIFYNLFAFGGPGAKPAWVPRGNSIMQDEARSLARKAIATLGATP